jgi:MoxR-like ATPase
MTANIQTVATLAENVLEEVGKAIVGKKGILDKVMAAFLTSGGHVLLEDYPGLAKTLVANSFAQALGMDFKRIQFTPDLLPGDITGGNIYDRTENKFFLRKGPLFTNVILADEINRASPKTQSALLEAMQEYQVTIDGETMMLPDPFIVIATQNPIEYEGTFPLPEAQLDRFMMKLPVGYPSIEEETLILRNRRERRSDQFHLNPVTDVVTFLQIRDAIEDVYVDPDIERYIVELVAKTRVHRQVVVGSSPRGALALLKLARSSAAMQGRNYVLPDDVKSFARAVLSHRIILEPDLWNVQRAADDVVDDILRLVPVPVMGETG